MRTGITQPRVLHKVDPTYSQEAARAHVQGSEVFSIIVDANGNPRDLEVLSPLAWGLDQKGAEAILKWQFAPGTKDGMPVNVQAQVEVNFRLLNAAYDAREEQQRASYSTAIANLETADLKPAAMNTIEKLASEEFPPAMSLLGKWKIEGSNVAKDVPEGLNLIRKAADKFDGDALFALARFTVDGQIVPANPAEGIKLMARASFYGNRQAQMYLGMNYETGGGPVSIDASRARYYFKLCAARGDATCQFHLGKLLLPALGDRIAMPWSLLPGSTWPARGPCTKRNCWYSRFAKSYRPHRSNSLSR